MFFFVAFDNIKIFFECEIPSIIRTNMESLDKLRWIAPPLNFSYSFGDVGASVSLNFFKAASLAVAFVKNLIANSKHSGKPCA